MRTRNVPLLVVLSLFFAAASHAAEERRPAVAAGGVLDQFAGEPTVRECQEVAMKYALVSDNVLNGYQAAAKWTKVLPRTQVQYRDNVADNNGVNVDESGARSLSFDNNETATYNVNLEWRLDEMLMGPTRVQAIRETSRLVQLRDDVLDQVTKVYFDRRRVQVDLLTNPPQDPKARAAKDLRLDELTANLDALTGGWFGQRLKTAPTRGHQ
jgi:hypothetical protein